MTPGLDKMPVHPADKAPIREGDWRYVRQTASHCVVFGSQGQFVDLEELVQVGPHGRPGLRMMLPAPKRQIDGRLVLFLWERRLKSLSSRTEMTPARHAAEYARFYTARAFHRYVLRDISDQPLATFLNFLDCWTPDFSRQVFGRDSGLDAHLVFRFQYDDEFLHERHAAQLAWRRANRPTPA